MCGHVGVAGADIGLSARDAFRDLLIFDAVRGIHGTGVASVDFGSNVIVAKRTGDPYQLFDHKTYDKAVSMSKRVLIGHNRHATIGSHSHSNAHPFDFQRIVGAHNGTVSHPSKAKMENASWYDTDSESIIGNIDHLMRVGADYEEAVETTIGKLDGAWALVMYFKNERKLAFLRNEKRPFYYCYAEEYKYLFWASEVWMLTIALSRNNIKIDDKIMALPEDTLLTFDVPVANAKFEVPTRKKVKGFELPASVTVWSESDYGHFNRGSTGGQRATTFSRPLARLPNENKNGHFRPPYKDHRGAVIAKARFNDLIEAGVTCVYCNSKTPVYGEEVCFCAPSPTGSPQFVCEDCVHDEQVMDIVRAMRV